MKTVMDSMVADTALTGAERREIERLLALAGHVPPTLEDMWALMDRVWDEFGCDNKRWDWERIGAFYRHPVWILNGLFIERDALSMQHREAIAGWIRRQGSAISRVLDYGGGFGTLARVIARDSRGLRIDVLDPYPSEAARAATAPFPTVAFIETPGTAYDCLVSTDVLEHVPDPLATLAEMIGAVREGGYLLIANHFAPSIKCHLPAHFHFRFTFDLFAARMGLAKVGRCEGSHAKIYRKKKAVSHDWAALRRMERLSRAARPVVDQLGGLKQRLSR